ncbi:MAG TPA: primosomal protein N' [Streptosporangiaceae bacterium]|nr:primosomal protein N' [Streptosporangiaceae bacterium]
MTGSSGEREAERAARAGEQAALALGAATQVAGPATRSGSRRAPRRRGRKAATRVAAEREPVARVAVDVPLPHLDRLFDYLVPQRLAGQAVPGCRVRVRFAGRLTGGYVVKRAESSEHEGRLAFIERVLSPEPVLTPEIAGLARAVADRYGGTMADVLRLAIPPRHATVEAATAEVADLDGGTGQNARAGRRPADVARRPGPWARYPAGPALLAALADGRSPRAVWSALPGSAQAGPAELGPAWPEEIALAVAATVASGRGALVIVPDARDLELVEAALARVLGRPAVLSLTAQLGPAERYRRWLAVLRGQVKVVAGTRSAMFAPVADLGLVVLWDEGDDLHAEPRAPYPHARDVLMLRAHRDGAAALLGGYARTAEAAQLIATGWAKPVAAGRPAVHACAPLIRTAGDDAELARDEAARTARMPGLALRIAREALTAGPVLFQVPRRGYLAAVACQRCGTRIRCGACAGPVALAGPYQPLRCGWCGAPAGQSCAACGGTGVRALVTGERRTAEELSRAFPGVPVMTSSGAAVLAAVPDIHGIVIATPGAEPRAARGYAAAILLDGWALLARPSLRAGEEALRRWMNAAALVRPRADGGNVVIMADQGLPPVQALIRWDPATHADRELAERAELRFPPAARIAALTGADGDVRELLSTVSLPADTDVLGPVAAEHDYPAAQNAGAAVRYLVRAASADGTALAVALRAGLAVRSAAKSPGQVRLRLDPGELI